MLNKFEISEKVQSYVSLLIECRSQENDNSTLQLYDHHIEAAKKLIEDLKTEADIYSYLPQYFESESRAYGWSFLPNENGENAEAAFWNLKKKYSLSPNSSKMTQYQLGGMTLNERLYVTGMMKEFDEAMKKDKNRAAYILRELYVDEASIREIIK